jgi:hypothetical protein
MPTEDPADGFSLAHAGGSVSTTKICGTDNDFNRPSGTGPLSIATQALRASAVWTFGEGHFGEFSPGRSDGQCGPKWPKKRSPGFTLGRSPHPNCPEGAMRYRDNRLGTFEPDRVRVSSPFRAKRLFLTNPGLTLG